MNLNYYKTLKNKCPYNLKYFFIVYFSIIFYIIINLFNKGPPLPPFSKDFTSIDCHSLKFNKLIDYNGKLEFSFFALPSIEYPPEYLVYFLTVEIISENASFNYTGDFITFPQRDENYLNFTLFHSFAGNSLISVKCLNNIITNFNTKLNNIEIVEESYSSSDFSNYNNVKFHNVCLEYEKFLYFTQIMGNRPSVPFDNDQLRFEFLKWPLSAYLDHKKVNLTHEISYLIAPFYEEHWKNILFNLLPLTLSIEEQKGSFYNNSLFIFRKEPNINSFKTLSYFSQHKPIKLHDIMCFSTLLLTKTKSNIQMNNNLIENSLNLNMNFLRNQIKRNFTIKKRIVIDENLFDELDEKIKNKFELIPIKQSLDLIDIIQLVSSAEILIGNHINNLIHLIWLNENSIIIDATPKDYSCNNWINNLSKKFNLNLIKLFNNTNCNCNNFNCLPSLINEIDINLIYEKILEII